MKRYRILATLGIMVVVVAMAGVAPALAVTTAPHWHAMITTDPTAFSASDLSPESVDCKEAVCDKFQIIVSNVGVAATDGSTITVTDILPPGLTTSETLGGKNPEGEKSGFWTCVPLGGGNQKVECTHAGAVAALAQLPPIRLSVKLGSGVFANTLLTDNVVVEGGGAPQVEVATRVLVEPTAPTLFAIADFENLISGVAGEPDLQAADHPASLTTSFDLASVFERGRFATELAPARPAQLPKDVVVDFPVGFAGDPRALPRCTIGELVGKGQGESFCPVDSQVGVVTFSSGGKSKFVSGSGNYESIPIYNLVPSVAYPAQFGFVYQAQRVLMSASVRTGSDYGVRVSVPGVPSVVNFQGAEVTFFGNPVHQDEPSNPGRAFFTDPSHCNGEPLKTVIHADSWENPAKVPLNPDGSLDLNAANFSEPQWKSAVYEAPPLEESSCAAPEFHPSFSFLPENHEASTPSGYSADLHIPQEHLTEPETLATADLKKTVVKLPAGLVVDPSSAAGLAACTEEQIGLNTSFAATCPAASKLGTVEVDTPLLEETPGEAPLKGGVYIAKQGANPFHSLLAIYIVVEGHGVVVKLPGEVKADPVTGQLTATFDNNPQQPFEDFKLRFFGGSSAPLTNPPTCGEKVTETELTPWSAPQAAAVSELDHFSITSGPGGAACISSVSQEPNKPAFSAGTVSSTAATYSPFVLKLVREDGSQALRALNVTLPPGLIGKIAGVAQCSQPDIEQAEHRSHEGEGVLEQSSPSCPAASEVGTVNVGAGSGTPFYVQGHAYFAGPYKGAPFSLVIDTPAVAGPFDLGTVVVRSGLYIDPATAQVTVKSDAIPQILDGIPLDIRSIAVNISRDQFTLNPTSCDPMAITGTAFGQSSEAPLSARFQAGGCASLPFHPSFTASTSGTTSKANGASFVVKVSQKGGEANIHKVDLQLPLALPARLTTLQKACTEAQFNANPAGCPEGSFIGTAIANTPVLPVPLTGPAILVSHGGAAFPDVEFLLQGDGVEIVLDGGTDIKKGITYSKFETVPDAPISSFETVLPEGPHSALAANAVLCGQTLTAPTTLTGQNGAVVAQNTNIAVTGCGKPSVKLVKTKIKGNAVLVTVITTQPGTVTISGAGLTTLKKAIGAGSHKLKVALSGRGRTARKHHRKTRIRASIHNNDGSSTRTSTLKL
jgi:hypothetical protein